MNILDVQNLRVSFPVVGGVFARKIAEVRAVDGVNLQVEKGHELGDEEIQSVISSLIRKGKEAAKEFRAGNREDLAVKEEDEIKVLYGYLPEQLTLDQIEENVREIISELNAKSPKDMGGVMKAAMARMAGRAQGKDVSDIARKLLGAASA